MKSITEIRWLELLRKPAKTEAERRDRTLAGEAFSNELKLEILSLSNELKAVGSKFLYPWDMVNSKEIYPEAIDILIEHLHKPYHEKNKEGIIRALTVKEAKGRANSSLINEYNNISKANHHLRWIIGNAFTVIITPGDFESVSSIVEDKSNGISRYRFVEALGKIKTNESKACLQYLLDDEEMKPFAEKTLKKFK